MSFLSDLIDKGKDLLSFEQRPPTETEAIKRNSFDRADFDRVITAAPTIKQMQTQLEKTVDYADDFMADLHAAVFKVEPTVRDAEEMKPTHVANRAVMEKLLQMPEMTALRQYSTGDVYGSALAMVAMKDTAVETLKRAHSAIEEAAAQEEERQKERERRRKEIEDQIEDLKNNPPTPEEEQLPPGPPGPNGEPGLPGGRGGQLQQRIDQFGQLPGPQGIDALKKAAADAVKGMENPLRSNAKKAAETAQEEETLMSSFGVDPGDLQRMNVKERMKLAHQLANNRLAQFAKLLGQFKTVQQAEARKRVVNAASEVHGITTGDDLTRMASSELLNFADVSLEDQMWLRWSEGDLSIYDVRGKDKLGQGPIIVVCDESGSMTCGDVAGGTREAWSKALALALCDQAKRRKRDFVYIGFSNYQQQHVIEFPGGAAPVAKVIEMTEHFFNGGTHFETPLLMALKIVEEKFDGVGKARPDIVFITDDAYGAMDEEFMHEWNRVKDKTSLKCYGIAIGCEAGGSLNAVSDNVREITALVSDPKNMADIFRTI